MSDIKNELKKTLLETLIPESENYLSELNEGYEKKTISSEDKETIRDMESFLVELQNILLLIEENKITTEEAEEVYNKITLMLNEHDDKNHQD